ncbi:MAG TPA: hypothetical protein VIG99_21995 [Myxococcaceae bacterium]|jgi:hypothetical protein
MASGLLMLAAVMFGCLVPQDYRFSDDAPPFKNNPVKIVHPDPPGTTITLNNGIGGGGGTACSEDFAVSAEDPDLNDPITVRWYVDYDPGMNPGILREQLLSNVGSAQRGPSSVRMDLNAPGNPLVQQGFHVVEVLVADGLLDDDRLPLPKSVDPDAGVNPSFVDRYVWTVKTLPGDCPLP